MPAKLKKVKDAKALIPPLVEAAMGATTFRDATATLSPSTKDALRRALGQDVDKFRQEFGDQLRAAGLKALEMLDAKMDEIQPGQLAYTLAVLVDKAQALDGKSSLASAAVNIQVNNYGDSPAAKQEAIRQLLGDLPSANLPPQP